ncbi:IS1595 family transposase [Ruminococcus albus]|uniref:IS1595 family transposase n=1 Tax=Ruminococcus albus TaxID=1264 RepID=UPI0004646F85|nr:IS1595 family transposase [Ruminococcus albus]
MSKRFPKPEITLDGIYSKFADEGFCKDFLLDIRFEKGFACTFCGGSEYLRIRSRHLLRCKFCKADISATNGTFMHRTHIPLRLWIVTAFLIMSNKCSVSAVTLMRSLGVTYKTAWYILQCIRKAMKCREERYLLDEIVELDDTYLGAPTHGKMRGRGTEKVKMIVALSKNAAGNPEYVKMSDVPNLKGITVGRFARDNIRAGSKIESDNARSYKKPLAQKYFHVFETYDPTSGQLNLISISNPCRGYIDVSADIITNKPDRKHHGLGLKSVRNTL